MQDILEECYNYEIFKLNNHKHVPESAHYIILIHNDNVIFNDYTDINDKCISNTFIKKIRI